MIKKQRVGRALIMSVTEFPGRLISIEFLTKWRPSLSGDWLRARRMRVGVVSASVINEGNG